MKKLFLLLTAIITLALSSFAQDRTVSGVVLDADTDEPLIGASVTPIGGGTGTATDIDGKFTLRLPEKVREIEFTYVGCKAVRMKVAPEMTVKMENNNRLNEVVSIGYGSQQKLGSVVGTVATVSSEQLEDIPTATFVDALQGAVSGLSVSSMSGDPSSTNNNIHLRGISSLSASITPLFILDGAPVTSAVFTTLNPSDIESITVLKDAASTAIYGSRAANGVIVITSKRGKLKSQPKISIRANIGWSAAVQDNMKMMNAKEYVKYRDLTGVNVPEDMRYAVDVLGVNTDWTKETFDSHAPTYSVEGVVSGGGDDLGYYLSLNHYEADGIIAQSHMRRETLRFSIRSAVRDWMRLGLQTNLGYTKYETNGASNSTYSGSGIYLNNPMVFARMALPVDATRYWTRDENGNAVWGDRSRYLHFSGIALPQTYLDYTSVLRNQITANTTLWEEFYPIKGLILRAQQNVDAYDYRGKGYQFPMEAFTTPMGDVCDFGNNFTGSNSQAFERYYAWTYTNTAEYDKQLNDRNHIRVLLGQESIIRHGESFGAYTTGQTDKRMMLLQQGTDVTVANQTQSWSDLTYNSYFLMANYDLDEKYYVTGSLRRDGSSLFAPGHRWSTFWSLGAMWNLKRENFLKDVNWLDDLRFNLSYGTAGNSGLSSYYAYMGLVGQSSTTYQDGAIWGITGAPNNQLSWETVHQFDMGINFRIWNRFDGNIAFYNKVTKDMLQTIPYSMTTGMSAGWGNVGSMRNTGFEFTLDTKVLQTKDWYWGINLNFSYNHNAITELFDGQDELVLDEYSMKYQVGHDSSELYLVRWAGVDPQDGQQMWYDADGNITKTFDQDDAVLIGKSYIAPWHGGFGTTLRWKDLALKIDFAWTARKYMMNNDRLFAENNANGTTYNQMRTMLNVWTTPGQITDIPAADGQVTQFDSHLLENASYMRMKNLTLSYSLPQAWMRKAQMESVTFHFTGRNLLTFSNFTGYDPEPETNMVQYQYPNTRQYEFGVEVTF